MPNIASWLDDAEQGINNRSLREQARRIIRARIVSGRMEPEVLHSIGAVAEELKVSITPVREALRQLANEGLIEIRRNRGFFVRTPTAEELDNIVQVRSMLEVAAVKEVTQRGLLTDTARLHQLCRSNEAHALAGEWEAFVETDRAFHLGLIEGLNNPTLVEIVSSLRDQSRLPGLDRIAGTKPFVESTKEHALLLDAMERGQDELAAKIMRDHLGHVRGIWAGQKEFTEE